uniref:Outer dense fiber protein 1 n=1 Tax=Anas platyrhynchos TaxID=8839 RepID=A0A8B9QT92_ANAPL
MSLFNHVLEDAEWDLRQAEREMQRQVRLLDRQLRHLPLPHPPCPCLRPRGTSSHLVELTVSHLLLLASELPTHSPTSRSARRCSCFHCSIQRRSNRLPCASRDRNVLAVMDMKGFDPEEVSVKVKDRKVQVLAEHEEAHTSARGREYNYKNVRKEISLPPGVREDEVTYSVGSNRIMKIETAHKHCPSTCQTPLAPRSSPPPPDSAVICRCCGITNTKPSSLLTAAADNRGSRLCL